MPTKVNVRTVISWASSEKFGVPDYKADVSRGITYAGVTLKPTESVCALRLDMDTEASPVVSYVDPLPPGEEAWLVCPQTGIASVTCPAGYNLKELMSCIGITGPLLIRLYRTTGMITRLFCTITEDSLIFAYQNMVHGFSTLHFDPDHSHEHVISMKATNIGPDPIMGHVAWKYVLEEIGTEKITNKRVRCKYCGHEEDVSYETTLWDCPECRKENLFEYAPWGRMM